jgi:hypothetical protein
MLDHWNKIKSVVFQKSLFKVPLWLWFGPSFALVLLGMASMIQHQMMPLSASIAALGLVLSAWRKIQGALIASVGLIIASLFDHHQIVEPLATYWLYTFGIMTAFLITSYSVEEYEGFIEEMGQEAKKNGEDVKLWQNRFEACQHRLDKEKERIEKVTIAFEKKEDEYLERIEQLEKMFHSSTYELKQEQNRGYQLHQELKSLLVERYEFHQRCEKLQTEIQELNATIDELHSRSVQTPMQPQPQPMTTEEIVMEIPQTLTIIAPAVAEEPIADDEENIYFSSS